MANRLDSMLTEKQRLAMMADMMGNPDAENMSVLARTASIPAMPQNYIQNSRTGAVTSLDEFAPNALMRQMQPALDYKSGPVEIGGVKGYRLAGDPFTVQMADGSRLSLGNDMEAGMKRDTQRAQMEAARLKNQETGVDIQTKQAALAGQKLPQLPPGYRWKGDGSMEAIPGGPADNKALTEFQGKSAGYGTRAQASHEILNSVGQDGKVQPGLIKRVAEAMPIFGDSLGTIANVTQSDNQQQVEQAQRDFINAVLRQESGAAISPSEFDNARKQYFPQPGDSPAVIAQKKANRETSIQAFATSAGPTGSKQIQNMKQKMQLIGEAKKAIASGAPVEAVKQRLAELGITDQVL